VGEEEVARQETGDRRQETGDRRQEAGDRRQETGDRRQETGGRRQEKKPPFAATDPTPMLEHLRGTARERKLRLFAVAACGHSLESFGHYELDDLAEYAAGLVEHPVGNPMPDGMRGQLEWATSEMCDSLNCLGEAARIVTSSETVDCTSVEQLVSFIREAHQIADMTSTAKDESTFQAHLARCIFGNPFRPVAFDPRWRSETAVALASAIYDGRHFDRLPILADALEDAGCDSLDLLNHLRGPGPHARGCWPLDLVLSKS
jgi:hypothetical protein